MISSRVRLIHRFLHQCVRILDQAYVYEHIALTARPLPLWHRQRPSATGEEICCRLALQVLARQVDKLHGKKLERMHGLNHENRWYAPWSNVVRGARAARRIDI